MVYSEHDANFYALDKQVEICIYVCVVFMFMYAWFDVHDLRTLS